MTTPRDAIAGPSERLREVRKQLAPHAGKKWLKPIDEAATQLDALSARVKELEAERNQMAEVLASPLADKVVEYAERATRAEQERDEAYELAAGVAEQKVERYVEGMSGVDVRASFQRGYRWKDGPVIAAAIRRLAAGGEEGK